MNQFKEKHSKLWMIIDSKHKNIFSNKKIFTIKTSTDNYPSNSDAQKKFNFLN